MKYIKQFATNAAYENYINSEGAFFPNVSVVKEVEDDEDVYYNPSGSTAQNA